MTLRSDVTELCIMEIVLYVYETPRHCMVIFPKSKDALHSKFFFKIIGTKFVTLYFSGI